MELRSYLITHFESVDLNNYLWLDGPQLLRNVEQYLDKTKFVSEATCIGNMTVKSQGNAATMGYYQKRSENGRFRYPHLMKVTAWALRFISNCHLSGEKRNLNKHLPSTEISRANKYWIKSNQRKLRINPNYDNLKNLLNLKEDDEGIIRSRGRIKNANVPYDTKEPTMLDRDHKLTELII